MNNASLELGGTNWAEKDGSLLGYTVSDDSGRFFPQEFTFTRGSNLAATRIGKTGLIEKGRENLVLQSNQFDTTWGTTRSSVTGGQSGYDGSNDAWKLIGTTPADGVKDHYLRQSFSATGVLTVSGYFKAAEKNTIRILFNNSDPTPRVDFDLANGSVHNKSNVIAASIVSVGNGWYRCSVTGILTVSALIQIYATESLNATSWVGDDTSGVYIQDAQLEQGLAASPYIETTTTTAQAGVLENTPRLNYTTGVADPYLLLEPSRTNLIPHSELINTSTYYISNNVLEEFAGISPDGSNTAIKVTSTGYTIFRPSAPLTLSTNTTYTFTFYAKNIDASGAWFRVYNASAGNNLVNTTSYFNELTIGEWVRVEYTFTTTATDTLYYPYLQDGNQGGSILYWGAQLEKGSYPTSYIPTYSVSATRAADACYKTNASGVIGQTEGTIYWNFKSDNTSLYKRFALSDGTTSNWIFVGMEETGGLVRGYIRNNGSIQFTYTGNVNLANTRVKIALAYKENDFALYVNGSLIGVDNSGTIPLCDRIDIGSQNPTSNINSSTETYQAEVYKERLTNAELITLTTV